MVMNQFNKGLGHLDKQKKKKSVSFLLRLALVLVVDALALWFIWLEAKVGNYTIVAIVTIAAMFISIVFLYEKQYPLRWMSIGLVLMLLFSVFPNAMTIYIAFTNYGTGHLLTREIAMNQISKNKYLPEDGEAYKWTAFRDEVGDYILWLTDSAGDSFMAVPEMPLIESNFEDYGVVGFDDNGIPTEITGYTKLNAITASIDQNLPNILFGDVDNTIQIRSPQEAANLRPLYVYDDQNDQFVNQETGTIFRLIDGSYISDKGEELIPGFRAWVGMDNFREVLTNKALRGPLKNIVLWNFIFPAVSVFLQFAVGLAIAILFSSPDFKAQKLVRSLLIIPYTIPGLITILIWRGMLNPEVGIVNRVLENLFNISPMWFDDKWLARGALVLVNVWLGYPYYMLVTSGALQSIPTDVYQAAKVDGANGWQSFRKITMPLLLVAVGPLLLSSYVYNFNNFNLIYLFINGGPPIPGASMKAGYTDIMISFVYNLAFSGGRGINYGLASAITILIFFIVIALTLIQFRFTNMWEEVSENV